MAQWFVLISLIINIIVIILMKLPYVMSKKHKHISWYEWFKLCVKAFAI